MTTAETQDRTVSGLVRDLSRAVLSLVRSIARMFGAEVREVMPRLGRRFALLVGSSVVAGAGLLLVLGGVAVLAEQAFRLPRWAALAVVGFVALGAGALGVRAALRKLGDPDLAFPETVSELAKDVAALGGDERVP